MNMTHRETAQDGERAAYAAASEGMEDDADAAQSSLVAHAALGDRIRHQADVAQLRLAMRNLTEGVRGMIRVSPLSSVFLGVVFGIALGKRGIRRAKTPKDA